VRLRFVFAQARREARASIRRVAPHLLSVGLGVGALVAIQSARDGITVSVQQQARQLLGGDLRISSSQPLPRAARAALDSVVASGGRVAFATTLASMVATTGGQAARLMQVRAISTDYPLYGGLDTRPAGALRQLAASPTAALAEPSALIQLGARIGDTLAIGQARFTIVGTAEDASPDAGFRALLGPRVYVRESALPSTRLLVTGSLANYEAFAGFRDAAGMQAFLASHDSAFRGQRLEVGTAEGRARSLSRALERLAKFLGLAGVAALMLGGLGVASAVGAYVRERTATVAVLRCLGATGAEVFAIYVMEAAALGLVGAAAGAVLGILAQLPLRPLVASSIPVAVHWSVSGTAVAAGLITGVWVAVVFALVPLADVLNVPPLRALRRDYEPAGRRRMVPVVGYVLVALTILVLALWQSPGRGAGVAFAAAVSAAIAALWALAAGLKAAARRWLPRRAGYSVRQGIANLFRPRNQTSTVTVALGLGVFVIATMTIVRYDLVTRFTLEMRSGGPDLLLFDIQPDQRDAVARMLRDRGVDIQQVTPIVPAHIAALRGHTVAAWLAADTGVGRPARWALRRDYRNTYRDTLTSTEALIAGRWWHGPVAAGGVPQISVAEDVARDLGVGVGDSITWNVQGAEVPTVVTSIRRVEWARFAPNFFVVFQPGAIDRAPQMLVALANVPDDTARARLQVALVHAFPNIAVLDLDRVQQAITSITRRVTLAVRILGGLALAAGALVLIGALATSRRQRLRETALLRALGADRRRILAIMVTEFVALGALGALSGTLLAIGASWGLAHALFGLAFRLPLLPLLVLALAVIVLTAGIGALNGRQVTRQPPLAVLRETME
jgi:putative ABC transport system permease protein